jgi:hypothetical protein
LHEHAVLGAVAFKQNRNVSNGRESAVNRAIDGNTNPSLKLVPSSLCKKDLVVKKNHLLYLELVMPSSWG